MDLALAPALAALSSSSSTLSPRLETSVSALSRAASAATTAIASRPATPRQLAVALAPLGAHMEDAEEASLSCASGDVLEAHLAACAAAARAFGCVAAQDPAGCVADARAMAMRRLAAVRSHAREHAEWADCLDALLLDLAAYCKKSLPGPLAVDSRSPASVQTGAPVARKESSGVGDVAMTPRAKAASGAAKSERSRARGGDVAVAAGAAIASGSSAGRDDRPSVRDFDAIISGPLAEYASCAGRLGSGMEPQTKAFVGAFEAERDFLGKAAVMDKPAEVDLSTIAGEMGKVADFVGEYPPRAELKNHVTAVGESVAALG